MEDLEQKVQYYLNEKANLGKWKADEVQELIPLQAQIKHVQEKFKDVISTTANTLDRLKAEILAEMTEKTHKFDCATVQKRVTRRLAVNVPLTFFHSLPIKMQQRVKLSFPGSDIIKAVEIGVIDIAEMAEITESESLVVKPN